MTTAKQQAQEIIDNTKKGHGIWYSSIYNFFFGWKKSALREVKKIMKWIDYERKETIEFWEQVKIEIENYKE